MCIRNKGYERVKLRTDLNSEELERLRSAFRLMINFLFDQARTHLELEDEDSERQEYFNQD